MKAALLLVILSSSAFAATPFKAVVSVTSKMDQASCAQFDGDIYDDPAEIDYFSEECNGFGGWRLLPYGGDSRSFVKIEKGNQIIDLQDTMTRVGQFPNLEGDVEWRVKMVRSQSATPFALLVEVSGQSPTDVNKSYGKIIVVKLGERKSCEMAQIDFNEADPKAKADAWTHARAKADTQAEAFNCP